MAWMSITQRCSVLFAWAVWSACTLSAQRGADVRQRVQEIEALSDGLRNAPQPAQLTQRARLLLELLDRDPASALPLMLSATEQAALRTALPEWGAAIESDGEWTGVLETVVEDDFQRGQSRIRYYLRARERSWEVHWPVSPAVSDGRGVRIAGLALEGRILATRASALPLGGAPKAGAACTTLGDQRTVVLLVDFPSKSLPPNATVASARDAFFGPGRSLNTMWQEYSYGRASASGDVAGPFRLDADYTCDQTDQIKGAAIRAADATVDFRNYSRVFIVMPSTGSCSWTAQGSVGCGTLTSPGDGDFQASTSWLKVEADWPATKFAEAATHEGGHNLGLQHARSLDYGAAALGPPGVDGIVGEYGDSFSNMGTGPGHWAAPHKSLLGWFPSPANVQQVEQPGAFVIRPLETASSSAQSLRVRRGAQANQWLWLEYRQASGLDAALPAGAFAGAMVHYEDAGNPGAALDTRLLDFNPASTPNSFSDAPLPSGRGWSDPYSNLTFSVGAATASGLDVTVAYDTPCATLSPQARTHGPEAETGTISVAGAASCSWQAVANAGWIALTGAQSGSGGGSVAYSLQANTTDFERQGTIFIGRQAFAVTQSPQPQALSVSPSAGSGASQTFSLLFRDSTDYRLLQWADVNFTSNASTPGSCYVRYDAAVGGVSLRNDGGTAWIGPVTPGAGGVVQNSQCALSAAGSSVNGAGATLTLNLALSFKAGFLGARDVYLQTRNATYSTGWQQRGTWTVNAAPAVLSVTPDAGNGPAQIFNVVVSTPGGYGTLSGIQVNFATTAGAGANTCLVALSPSAGSMWASLLDDGGTTWTGVMLGGSGKVGNSQCVLYGPGSSASGSGNEWRVNLSVAFRPAFAGAKKIWVQAASIGYWTDWQLRGSWTATSSPLAESVIPDAGSGTSQAFALSYSDPAAYTNLQWADVNFNSSTSTANSCYLRYDAATGGVSLRNDGDTAWLGPVPPGGSGVLQNTQCLLSAAGSSVSGAGANLTLSVALSFKPAIQGARNVYLQTRNASASTGWQLRGTWTVNAAPAILSVTPDTGGGLAQVFSVVVSTPGGYNNLAGLHVNFGTTGSANANTCLLAMAPSGSGMWASLRDDSGTSWAGLLLGSSGKTENSQCVLDGPGSSASGAGTDWTVNLAITFKPAYAGARKIWVEAATIGLWTEWQWRGTWTVANAPLTYSISGRVTSAGAALPGVTVTLAGGPGGTRTSDGAGNYSFPGLPAGGTYTVTPALPGYSFTPASRTLPTLSANQMADFNGTRTTATLSLDRTSLNFAARSATLLTNAQTVLLSHTGTGTTNWTASTNQAWLQVSPAAGSGPARLTVSLVPASLPPLGVSGATVIITAPNATNAPLTLPVVLTRLATSAAPFGAFDTPTGNATGVSGSIAVTGWALDDIFVSKVQVYRDPIGGEPVHDNGLVYIGDAVFVPNARPDVESIHSTLPYAYRSGWGYLMLTTGVPNPAGPAGNGKIRLWAFATDVEGNTTNLGSKTITLDNATSKKPFGAIDTPGQGGTASGSAFVNFGWALTPPPNIISAQPTTIWVSVDGVFVAIVNYGQFRPDIAAGFPGFRNSGSAGGHFILDTTRLANGMHNIGWFVVDDVDNQDGVGSRFFLVENGVSGSAADPALPVLSDGPDEAVLRSSLTRPQRAAVPRLLAAQELERLVIPLPDGQWTGGQLVDGELRTLPVGSTLDNASGAFYWQLGAGFLGRHELLFTSTDGTVHSVTVDIAPKAFSPPNP